MTHPTRRDVVAGVAATAAAGFASRAAQAQTPYPNLFSALGKTGLFGGREWRFLGADGKEVDIVALRQSLSGHHTTAYIGFVGCDQYCPLTNRNMAMLSDDAEKLGTKLMHVIINAVPSLQGDSDITRTITLDSLEAVGLKPLREGRAIADSNAIVLFATTNGKASGLDDRLPARISEALGNRTRLDSARDHSPAVNLYAAGGTHIGRALGTDPTITTKLLDALKSQSRSR